MKLETLGKNIHWVGALHPDLRVFDIIMETKSGTTYNSYVINDEKVAVVDIVKDAFYDEFKTNLTSIIGDKPVDYIIVHHTELDHTGALKYLLRDYPEATVVGTKVTINYLKNILNREFKSLPADEDLVLGENTLSFIKAPNLHWPDTMFSYAKEQNILFTCDFTGSHYCPTESIVEPLNEVYFEEMKYYYDCIMGPFKKFVNSALEKIKDLKIDVIAPSHGPVHVRDIDKILNLYKEWSVEPTVDEKKIEIFYISAYGNTEIMANFFKDKLIERGFKADVTEITEIPFTESIAKIETAKGFMIGSPTINADAVKPSWDLLSMVSPLTNKGKSAMAFGSFGWCGTGVSMLTERLKGLRLNTTEGFKFCFVASEEDFKRAEESLENFIKTL